LAGYPKTSGNLKLPPAEKVMSFSSRSLSIVFSRKEDDWEEKDKPFLKKILEESLLLRQLRELNLEFKSMMECKKGRRLIELV
jgi:hypothetical protein